MNLDLFLKAVMALAAICGAVWASLQAYGWIDARRRRLHVVIEYGRYHQTPNILKTGSIGYQVQNSSEIRARLRKPDGTDHDLIAKGPGARESDLITRFNGYYRIRIENTGTTTIKGIRFLNMPDVGEAWTIKTSDRSYVTRTRPVEIDTLLAKDPVEILFLSYYEISEDHLRKIEIVHEGGSATISIKAHRLVPSYRLSPEWKNLTRSTIGIVVLFFSMIIALLTEMAISWLTLKWMTP